MGFSLVGASTETNNKTDRNLLIFSMKTHICGGFGCSAPSVLVLCFSGCGDREEHEESSSEGKVSAAEIETVKADAEVVPGEPGSFGEDVDAERPRPQNFSDFRKLLGSSLSEEEKQFVGRWSGEDSDGRWGVINRVDHTRSYLDRGPDGKEFLIDHGSWAILNSALHVLA